MTPISVCIIARNEEKNIEECLRKLSPYGFEIIVTDTGSTDRTREIAGEYATRVLDYQWSGDFSAARNFTAAHASNEWILCLDCDEYITAINLPQLLTLIREYPQYVGLLEIENAMLGGSDNKSEHLYKNKTQKNTYTTKLVRLYSKKYYQFTGTIHEQITPLKPRELISFDIPLKVYHTGYIGTPEEIDRKNKRNIDLLTAALAKTPDDAYLHFQLGQSYLLGDDYEEACKWFAQGLSFDLDPELEYVQTMVVSYGQALLQCKRYEEALNFAGIYSAFSQVTDFIYLMGRIYLNNNRPLQALGEFLKAITMPQGRQKGINSFLAFYHIALINEQMGQTDIALMYYQKCGNYPPALLRLREIDISYPSTKPQT